MTLAKLYKFLIGIDLTMNKLYMQNPIIKYYAVCKILQNFTVCKILLNVHLHLPSKYISHAGFSFVAR